jgi:hypothetical protein
MPPSMFAGENDDAAGPKGGQLFLFEGLAQADVEDARDHSVDAILWMLVRRHPHARGHAHADDIGSGASGVADQNRQARRRGKRRERLPNDVFGADGVEAFLIRLVRSWNEVRLGFRLRHGALLPMRSGAARRVRSGEAEANWRSFGVARAQPPPGARLGPGT